MAEGETFACSWTRIPGGYRVWLLTDPSVSAEAAKFEDADELLYERILEASGDGENQHEYTPPVPAVGAGAIDRGRLWKLGQAEMVRMSHERRYFERGLCDNCLMPLGPRTELPLLIVSRLTEGANAATVKLEGAGIGNGPHLTIVSERLLAVFSDEERDGFEWRMVEGASTRRPFFELVPHAPTIPYVSPAGIGTSYGRCDTCAFVWTATGRGKGLPDRYVSEGDLPSPRRTLVAVNRAPYATLAVTDERWRTLVGRPELKGIKGSSIAIIAADAVEKPSDFTARERASRKW